MLSDLLLMVTVMIKLLLMMMKMLVVMKVLLPPGGGGLLEHQQSSSSSQVHYTLLVASVLLAFLLGAALSALLVSCYCGHQGAALGMGAGPEAALPRPLSLRSLARLNGLLLLDTSAQHKVGRT